MSRSLACNQKGKSGGYGGKGSTWQQAVAGAGEKKKSESPYDRHGRPKEEGCSTVGKGKGTADEHVS